MSRTRNFARASVCAATLAILLCAPSRTSAQLIPFFLDQGYAAAHQLAVDSLAPDVYLVYAGTFGDLDVSQFTGVPITLNFYIDSVPRSGFTPARRPGQADAWGYVFFSPSRGETVNLLAANLPLVGMQGYGVPVPLPIPPGLVDTLDLTVPGNRSDSLVQRLKRNREFAWYHARYPGLQPEFVSLGGSAAVGVPLPPGFPEGNVWTVNFSAGGDTSSMICLVSSASGETFCGLYGIGGAEEPHATSRGPQLAAWPNPATGRVRIDLALSPDELRGDISLALYSSSGAMAADLVQSLSKNGLRYAELDASTLPSGTYFCRAAGDGWSRMIPITIAPR